jgi:hypothetical protein
VITLLVCIPVDRLPTPPLLESARHRCYACGCEVWVSPAGQRAMEMVNNEVRVVCAHVVCVEAARTGPILGYGLVPGGEDELRAIRATKENN